MSYVIVGTAYVHKYRHDDKWFHEQLLVNASCDLPSYPEANEEFHTIVAGYDWDDLPEKEGYYAVQYAARITWITDCWAETDANLNVLWSNIVELSQNEVAYLLNEELPVEEKFVELINTFGGPVQKL